MSWLLAAIAAFSAQESGPDLVPFRDEYHCTAHRLVRGQVLGASQVSLADGTILGTQLVWSERSLLPPPGQPMPREGVFVGVRWGTQAMPADREALRRSLDTAIVRITIVTPTRLRRPPFLRLLGTGGQGPWLAPGGYAEVNEVFPWASVDVRWGTLRTEAGAGESPIRFELGHRRSAPIAAGAIDLAPIAEALDAAPGLLDDLPAGPQRAGRCELRRMRYLPITATPLTEIR